MPITHKQQQAIIDAHSLGFLDHDIADLAEVSLATVKRYRRKLGLTTHCVKAQRGRFGELFVADRAVSLGFKTSWRNEDTAPFDLTIAGKRVEVKTAMQSQDGAWRFRLNTSRSSFYSQYRYAKDYQHDCDVVALVCLSPTGEFPEVYFFDSKEVPSDLRIRPDGHWDEHKANWSVFGSAAAELSLAA